MNPATIVQKRWNYCEVLRGGDVLAAALEQFRLNAGNLDVDAAVGALV